MSSALKWTLGNIFVYVAIVIVAVVVDHWSPGGPCVPSGGILVLLLIPFLAAILFILSLIGRIRGDRVLTGPLIVNTVILLSAILLAYVI